MYYKTWYLTVPSIFFWFWQFHRIDIALVGAFLWWISERFLTFALERIRLIVSPKLMRAVRHLIMAHNRPCTSGDNWDEAPAFHFPSDSSQGPFDAHGQFCVSCDGYTVDCWNCVHNNHLIPTLGMLDNNLQNDRSNAAQHSNYYTDLSLDTTSGGSTFDTQLTQDSSVATDFSGYVSLPELHVDHQENELDSNVGMFLPQSGSEGIYNQDPYVINNTDVLRVTTNLGLVDEEPPLRILALSSEQEYWLNCLLSHCKDKNSPPDEGEMHNIAGLAKLPFAAVQEWVQSRLHFLNLGPLINEANESNVTLDHDSSHFTLPEELAVLEVKQWARKRFWRPCESPQSRKASSNMPYKCTRGCGYSTAERDAWQRHEQKWQPQEFWHCKVCRDLERKPYICSRPDKYMCHLQKGHADILPSEYNQLRRDSKVEFEAGFEPKCRFLVSGGECGYEFQSWDDRTEHYLEHFANHVGHGPWMHDFQQKRWFDDDEDDDDGGNGNSSSKGSYGNSKQAKELPRNGHQSHSASTQGNKQSRGTESSSSQHCRSNAAHDTAHIDSQSAHLLESYAGTRKQLSGVLIDVHLKRWLPPSPESKSTSKYVALDYSLLLSSCVTGDMVSLMSWDRLHDDTSLERVPRPFEEAVGLTGEMGYQYLRIPILNSPYHGDPESTAIFERSSFIIVLFSTSSLSSDPISHMTCHYRNLDEIRSWAMQSISFAHVQTLGYGAYGIVDEVEVLTSTRQSFARKVLLGRKPKKLLRSMQFHEIEIMQKLNHPNISQFVAAYFQRRTLNILMKPVADCDLKEFLSEPSRWPKQHSYLITWFEHLASALAYMHGSFFRHKDIKPSNILINGDTVILSDFGTSLDFSTTTSGSEGRALMTPKYCAPEVASGGKRGRKADVWSLGCVFVEMMTVLLGRSLEDLHQHLEIEIESFDRNATYSKHLKGLLDWVNGLSRAAPSRRHWLITRCCRKMLQYDEMERPTAMEVYLDLGQSLFQSLQLSTFTCGSSSKEPRAPLFRHSAIDDTSLWWQPQTWAWLSKGNQYTALHIAAICGDFHSIELLLEHGASFSPFEKPSRLALQCQRRTRRSSRLWVFQEAMLSELSCNEPSCAKAPEYINNDTDARDLIWKYWRYYRSSASTLDKLDRKIENIARQLYHLPILRTIHALYSQDEVSWSHSHEFTTAIPFLFGTIGEETAKQTLSSLECSSEDQGPELRLRQPTTSSVFHRDSRS